MKNHKGIVGIVLMVTATILLCATLSNAQTPKLKKSDFFKPYGKGFVTSTATYWAGSIYGDLKTRQCVNNGTCRERNGFLRTSTGKFRIGRALTLQGIGYGLTLLLEKKWPRLMSYIRFGGGAIQFAAGARNW